MKKIILSLSVAFLMSSCIVIKVYDTPKSEKEQPKVIATKRMMLPSDRHIPLPNGEQEILFFGEGFPPTPEVFHFEMQDSLVDQIAGDSLNPKGIFVIKLDNKDSLGQGMNFQWKSKGGMHHMEGHKMMKACCMMSKEDCTKKDSICTPISGEAKGEKSIRIIKIDKKQLDDKNTFVIKTKGWGRRWWWYRCYWVRQRACHLSTWLKSAGSLLFGRATSSTMAGCLCCTAPWGRSPP